MSELSSRVPWLTALVMMLGVQILQPQRGLEATWVFMLVWAIWAAGERARGGQ